MCNPTLRPAPEQKFEWSLRSDKLFCIVLRLPKSHQGCGDHQFLYPVEKEEGNDCCYTHFWTEKNCRFLKDLFLKDDNLVVSTTLQTMFPTSPSVLAPKGVPWGQHGTQTCWLEIRESHLQSQHTCISLFEVSQVKDHKSRYGSKATLYPIPAFPTPSASPCLLRCKALTSNSWSPELTFWECHEHAVKAHTWVVSLHNVCFI